MRPIGIFDVQIAEVFRRFGLLSTWHRSIDLCAILAYVAENQFGHGLRYSPAAEKDLMRAASKSKQLTRAQPKTAARSGARPAVKRDRLHLRLDMASRHKIERAASYLNKSASEFVLSQAVLAADKVIDTHGQTITLLAAEWDKFCRALERPHKVNRKLTDAARRYAKRGGAFVG